MRVTIKDTGFFDRHGEKEFILLEAGQDLTVMRESGDHYICRVPSVTKWPEHAWGNARIHKLQANEVTQ